MSTNNIIPLVNTFLKAIRADEIRFKTENIPAVAKSFVTIPAGSGAVKLEILKGTALCIHVYSSLEVVRRDSKVDFQLKNRVYASPLLSRSEDVQEFLAKLGAILPEAVHNGYGPERITEEIERFLLPLLRTRR